MPHEHESSDDQLIARINRGDDGAFQQLYDRYRGWVYQLAMRLTEDQHLAEEVLQETFVDFVSRFPGMEINRRLTTYLYPMVRHIAIRRLEYVPGWETGEGDDLRLGPLRTVGSNRTNGRDEFAEWLRGMPESMREPLILHYIDGMDLKEIAEALELPVGTVRARLHHSLDRLREYFDPMR